MHDTFERLRRQPIIFINSEVIKQKYQHRINIYQACITSVIVKPLQIIKKNEEIFLSFKILVQRQVGIYNIDYTGLCMWASAHFQADDCLQFLITIFFSILLYSGEVILGYKQYLKQTAIGSTKRNRYIFHDEIEHRTKFVSSFSSLGVRFSNFLPTTSESRSNVLQLPLTQNRNQFMIIQ